MLDFVFPKNNEEKLYKECIDRGKTPVFVYSDLRYDELVSKKKELKKGSKIAYLFSPESTAKLSLDKRIKKEVDFLIGSSRDLKTLRAVIEKGKVNYIVDIEATGGRDHTHYRRSNFNQVLARLCKENRVTYLINFSRLKYFEGEKRSKLLGRVMQNVRFMKKEKAEFKAVSFASNVDDVINEDCLGAFERIV
jgi:RNase P/RNase MRP subunit p30